VITLIAILDAKLDDFPYALHQHIEGLRLRVAASQGRNRRDVITLLIALDYHREFPLGFHLFSFRGHKYTTHRNKNGPSRLDRDGPFLFSMLLTGAILILAATYVPTQLPVQYHRPYGA
jgi:hypothetical protein